METTIAHNARLTGRIELPAPLPEELIEMAKKQAMQEKVPQKSETKNGNLNQAEQGEPPMGEGTRGSKSNGETATLRTGSLPKSEQVTTVDRDKNKGHAVRCAEKQNLSDGKTGRSNLAQVPVGKDYPTFVAVEDD